MAGETDRSKQVSFIGAWRTQHVSDQLLRQISNQIASKKKVATQVNISSEGLELLIFNNEGKLTRKDKIALENVVDFIDNKYRTTCTLAIVREKQQKLYTVFVFLCKSDRDAASLIHTFKTVKRQLSGEGYNTNLTPKGKNWVLQPKNEKVITHTINGDVKGKSIVNVPGNDVRVISTEKQNGGVIMVNTDDRHDSFSRESIKTSNSEVKEELHILADEVRDIKRLLQGSKGRTQFEKHYGYRILQSPPPMERQVTYVNRKDIDTRPIEPIPENIYIKNDAANVRYTNGGSKVIGVGGRVSRSTRQYRTKGHFVSVRSPTRQEYTKRVYNSENPYAESSSGIHPVRVIGQPTHPHKVIVQKPMLYKTMSQSSSIIHKNIEDVYKSRSIRKIYLPPSSQNSKTVEYVKSHVVETGSQDHQLARPKIVINKETQQNAVHVRYNPEVRTLYETRSTEAAKVDSNSQASTEVNTSVNDNLEDKMKQIESSLDIEQREIRQEGRDNLIVIKTMTEDKHRDIREVRENVTYVQNDEPMQEIEQSLNAGNVYHVRAEFKDDYERNLGYDDHVTVIRSTAVNEENVEDQRSVVRDENVTVISYDTPQTNDVHIERTITNGDGVVIIDKTEEFQDEALNHVNTEITETIVVDTHDGENVGLLGEYSKETTLIEDSKDDIIDEHSRDTDDLKVEIERQLSDRLKNKEEDGGLFGAYTKKPEEHDEPKDEVTAESSYRYHDGDDETVIRADKSKHLHASNRIAVFVAGEENTVSNSGVIREISDVYNENGRHMEEIENNGMDLEKNIEIIEEKHVRYNETIEQIPLADDDTEQLSGNVKLTRDMFEAGAHESNVSQNDFQNELSSVVSRIRKNYDEKIREDEGNSRLIEDEEEQYVLDMDALKAYSTEPDIVIVDSDKEKTNETFDLNTDEVVKTNTVVSFDTDENEIVHTLNSVDINELDETDAVIPNDISENESKIENVIEDSKEIVNEELDDEVLKIEGEHLDMFNRVNESEIPIDPKQASVTRDDIHEIINATEDKVLF